MLATETLYTPYNGAVLLENPLLNKGLAFTESERTAFNNGFSSRTAPL